MMLKTSSRKINPFWNMIGFTLRKNMGIIIVLCIIALLFCPGFYAVNFEDLFENRYTEINSYGDTPQDFTRVFGNVIAVFAPIFAVLFNYINFAFLYKKNASDVFHSFPLTRVELLLSRMLSGVFASLIPILLCTFFYVGMFIFNPWLGHFGTLLYYLALMLVLTLLWASFTMVFIVCAGSTFDLILSFFGINIAIIFVSLITSVIFDETLLGYNGDIEQILYQISLPFFCATHETVIFWIKSIIYTIAFLVLSLCLYNRRKAEKGGTAYAYTFMYYCCSVLISVCGAYLVGMIFDDNEISSIAFWIFALIGAVLSAFIYGLITNRGLKGTSRSIIMGGIAWVVLLSILITSVTGCFGFTQRIPDADKVKSVRISALSTETTFMNPDVAIALHKKVISNTMSYKDWISLTEETPVLYEDKYLYSGSDDVYPIYFNYTLKNGSTIARCFYVPFSTINDELLAVLKDGERYDNIIKESLVNEPDIQSIEFTYTNDYEYGSVSGLYQDVTSYISVKEYKEFLNLYWRDIQMVENFSETQGESIRFTIVHGDETDYFWLDFGNSFKNTVQFIKKFEYTYTTY